MTFMCIKSYRYHGQGNAQTDTTDDSKVLPVTDSTDTDESTMMAPPPLNYILTLTNRMSQVLPQ